MAPLHPRDLLLSSRLDFEHVVSLLTPYGFKEVKKADANLQLVADEPRARRAFSEIIEDWLECLSQSPDPDQALNYFERFTRATINKTQLLLYLGSSPYTLWLLSKLFGSSPFLSEILIRNPTYLYWITDPNTLDKRKSKEAFENEISPAMRTLRTKERKLETLCIFKRKELLGIGVRDLLRKCSVAETTEALSALAETIIQKVYELCDDFLRTRFGTPLRRAGSGKKARAVFTVLGMGKLGGGELNFSSDVDLLYLYDSGEGETSGIKRDGPETRISNTEYFRRLSQEITSALSGLTNEGYLYRVDLRLRPEGRSGQIAYPLKGYLKYYGSRGETWERLALLKAWPAAGDHALGRQFLRQVSAFVYGQPYSSESLGEVKTIKERIDRKIQARGETRLNVKLGMGGIREIEFVVQFIQTFFGKKIPQIRERNTFNALKKLLQEKILTSETYQYLTDAYVFLRNVEHSLQIVHEFQTHRLPEDPHELRICALRLDYKDSERSTASEAFLKDYRFHTEQVNRIFQHLFHTPQASPILSAALKRIRQTVPKRATKKR
jgi:[glutamine synthetase] adenylyltransferase / [glutamine synthetase]-adenylyl-L-tyrosine phosphorylase